MLRRLLLVFIIGVGAAGCADIDDTKIPKDFKYPIVVVGVSKANADYNAVVVLRDSTGKTFVSVRTGLAHVISENYQKGDTLK